MDVEQDESEGVAAEPSLAAASPPAKPKGRKLERIGVGAVVSFLVLSVLYGVNQAAMMLFFLVICTAGLGLIPILFLSWTVGWIVIGAVEAISSLRGPATVS